MAKSNSPKAAIHTKPQTTFGSQQAMENTRDWDPEMYKSKNKQHGHHYDYSRKHLNFSVGKDGIKPLDEVNSEELTEKFKARLAELDFASYKGKASNQPNSYMDWVFSGDHFVMNKMAFGEQVVDWDYKKADNSNIKRMPEIEEWAKDVYKFACRKWGEKNIIGVEVHLDETTVHAHVNVIPVAKRQTRGRSKTRYQSVEDPTVILTSSEWKNLNSAKRKNYTKIVDEERESRECVSYCGCVGETRGARSKYLSQIHTDFFNEVGCKYGLERGDYKEDLSYDEQLKRKHKNAVELEKETQEALKDLQEQIEEKTKELERQESNIKRQAEKIEEQRALLSEGESAIDKIKKMGREDAIEEIQKVSRLRIGDSSARSIGKGLRELYDTVKDMEDLMEMAFGKTAGEIEQLLTIHKKSKKMADEIGSRYIEAVKRAAEAAVEWVRKQTFEAYNALKTAFEWACQLAGVNNTLSDDGKVEGRKTVGQSIVIRAIRELNTSELDKLQSKLNEFSRDLPYNKTFSLDEDLEFIEPDEEQEEHRGWRMH